MAPAVLSAPATPSGTLLVYPGDARPTDAFLVHLSKGRREALPQSKLSNAFSEKDDRWFANNSPNASAELVRVDGNGSVDIFERRSMRRVGGFALNRLPGSNQPELYGPVKLSPDGRHLLAYWKKSYRKDKPDLVIFDRNGSIVESGSQFTYDRFAHRNAIDWLPDGRYIYLAGDRIVLQAVGGSKLQIATLSLPPSVSTDGSGIAVSPDGRRMLLSLYASLKDKAGRAVEHGLLFVSDLAGADLRQLTMPSARIQADGIRMSHTNATWSPDGKWVAFAPRQSSAYGAPYFRNGCPFVTIVSTDAEPVRIDGLRDDDRFHARLPGFIGPLRTCGGLTWLQA
jgi:Tol biopolymer transport system component